MYNTITKLARTLFGTATTRKTQPMGNRFRPRLECLEERAVPAHLAVTNYGNSGVGSLRWAIDQANANEDESFIHIPAATITLTSALPKIVEPVTIVGSFANNYQTRIQRDINAPNFRIFEIGSLLQDTRLDVALIGMTLKGGNVIPGNGNGGAVYLDNVHLEVRDVEFLSNRAHKGGAIYATEQHHSRIDITNSTFTSNAAREDGGAIYASDLFVSGTTFTSNSAVRFGGAVFLAQGKLGNFFDCIFNTNSATSEGGAIYAARDSELRIYDAGFNNNRAGVTGEPGTGRGGAIYLREETECFLDLVGFYNNQATDCGGAVVAENNTEITVEDSIFSGNADGLGPSSIYLVFGASYVELGVNVIYLDAVPEWGPGF